MDVKGYEVLAGSYEGNEPNCKYADSFDTLEAALEEYNRHKSRPWAALQCVTTGGFITLKGFCPFNN